MIKATVDRLRVGLRKTSAGLSGRLRQLLAGKVTLDQATLERIEELLIGADMGVKSSVAIVQNIERRLQQEGENASLDAVMQVIRSDVKKILTTARPRVSPPNWAGSDAAGGKKKKKKKKKKQQRQNSAQTAQRQPSVTDGTADLEAGGPSAGGVNALDASATPRVIFVVGVNGSGKTTSIAKLAHMLQSQGQSVLLAAADTLIAYIDALREDNENTHSELTEFKASAGDVTGLKDQIKQLNLDKEGYATTLEVITKVFENISESIIILLALAQMPDKSATKEQISEKTTLAPVIVGRHVGILQEKKAVSIQGDTILLTV